MPDFEVTFTRTLTLTCVATVTAANFNKAEQKADQLVSLLNNKLMTDWTCSINGQTTETEKKMLDGLDMQWEEESCDTEVSSIYEN